MNTLQTQIVAMIIISILIILNILFLSNNNDAVSFSSSSFSSNQSRKIKGEHFFLSCIMTLLTIAYFGISFYNKHYLAV
ncbi:hypothetical protein J8J04_01655 ['Fragaria x ananassa' phyllody phytoplasma]|uniref:Protein-export membrane protein SecG n=1 Tax='Fragaria x ananassa' phyllody phytoplasma TaxID=2358428 RepID=A0ABS5K4Y6_9MOLU|nr:hypothetical protein ['Fragaria x ananassa' phyllody phytoplasma]MBS2126395.1 hypothetical protein ['Fragaria x ananassa' phyllody phytoplasma]